MRRAILVAVKAGGVLVLAIAALAAGYLYRGVQKEMEGPPVSEVQAQKEQADTGQEKPQTWTCSMHPQIRQKSPGRCPICGMDLVPVSEAAGEGPRLVMSKHAKKLAEIQTTPLERKFVRATVRLVGKVDYDETRVENITAWVPGRIDRMFVDYTGVPVLKGDHLVSLYSPELISAQEELLQARQALKEMQDSEVDSLKGTSRRTVEAAREKLLLWGLTEEQLQEIEQTGTPLDYLTIYAPAGGIVVEKHKNRGAYVKTGDLIYTTADLSHVWVKLDAYESDMKWIRYGQPVTLRTEAYPGETFDGRIAFISPVLNEKTRTVKLRIDARNPQGKLKPGMFVHAVVRPRLAASGQVMSRELSGKWICRMHPGVIKEQPGDCDLCDMPLVRTESLGYVTADEVAQKPLVVPASAPLITGKRAVVYVEVPGTEKPTYEGREVVLGPRADEYYLVESGLKEGERVVTQGNFKIDSALQIQAKPSMMSEKTTAAEEPEREKPAPVKKVQVPEEFVRHLRPTVAPYLAVHGALAGDSPPQAAEAAGAFLDALSKVKHGALEGDAHRRWMDLSGSLRSAAEALQEAGSIEAQREAFSRLSNAFHEALAAFGPVREQPLYLHFCPMAFDNRGAFWIQEDRDTLNPYFGSAMLRCGEVRATLPGTQEQTGEAADNE